MSNEEKNSNLVSIIVPTYNCEKYVKKTIESILKQTHSHFEVIVIDDCSSDSTVDIVNSLSNNRIKVLINKEHCGAAYSRNRGIAEAKGEYIAFLDSDDIWYENKLEEQLLFMETNNYDFSYTNYNEIDENDKLLGIVVSGPNVVSHKAFLRSNYVGCLTAMFKRKIYPDLCIPNTIYKRNDYALWLKLSEKVNCYRLNKVLASYRKARKSLSSGKKTSLIKYHKEMFQKLYNFGKIKSTFYAWRNALYYFFRRIKYVKKSNAA